jgi:hypothetical protein
LTDCPRSSQGCLKRECISPGRHRGHGEKERILLRKYSELCELRVSVVKIDPEFSAFNIRISEFFQEEW